MTAAATSISSAGGSKFYISSAVAADSIDTDTEFAALTWVEVGEVSSVGEIGDVANLIEASSLADNRVRRLPGRQDAGQLPVTVNFKASDTGQIACRTAADNPSFQYGFKLELNDKPDASDTNSTVYFLGKVTSARLTGIQVDGVVQQVFNIPVNSKPIMVVATAVP